MKWNLLLLRNKILKIDKKEHFKEYLHCHETAGWIKTKKFLIELSSAIKQFSIKTLFGGFIAEVTEKFEIDYRDKSLILNNF